MMSDGDSVELELEGSALSLEGKPRGTSRRGSCAAAELWISSARYPQGFPQAVDNRPARAHCDSGTGRLAAANWQCSSASSWGRAAAADILVEHVDDDSTRSQLEDSGSYRASTGADNTSSSQIARDSGYPRSIQTQAQYRLDIATPVDYN